MPKTVKEIKETVLSYGFNTRNYAPLIPYWIDEAIRDLFREANLRKKHVSKEFSSVVGTNEYELPSDFGGIISLTDLEETAQGELQKFDTMEEFDNAERTSGVPINYFIDSKIYLYPTPASVRKYRLKYSKVPAAIVSEESSNPDIREDFYHLIEMYCLYKAFQKEGDIEMKNDYKNLYDNGVIKWREEMNTDTKDSPEQVEGAWFGY